MYKEKRAFTLLELTVYLAVLALAIPLVCGFLSTMVERHIALRVEQERIIRMFLALDIIRRDIYSASNDPENWNISEQNPTYVVFRKSILGKKNEVEHVDVGWQVVHKKLHRSTGRYDYKSCQWKKKSTHLIAQDITLFTCAVTRDDHSNIYLFSMSYAMYAKNSETNVIRLMNSLR